MVVVSHSLPSTESVVALDSVCEQELVALVLVLGKMEVERREELGGMFLLLKGKVLPFFLLPVFGGKESRGVGSLGI